jgi:hypothetical protein
MADIDKGGKTEELLREYFLKAGYFVVRGAKIVHEGDTVTDVDLWLYLRGSSLSRERTNVDIKDRDRPRALERVLWAVGVRELVSADRVVVATTDRRPSVRSYAAKHEVDLLDGAFLRRLSQQQQTATSARLHDEEFLALIQPRDEKVLGDWRAKIEDAKTRVVAELSFDSCNALLEHARFFLDKSIASHRREHAARCFNYCVALFLVAADFATRTLAFEESDVRKTALIEGFRYGVGGAGRKEIELAARLAETYAKAGGRVRARVEKDLQKIPVEILAEYFGKLDVQANLFAIALRFEAAAYAKDFVPVGSMDGPMQGVVGALLDFFGVDREDLYGRF